jgi:hypothetical protein
MPFCALTMVRGRLAFRHTAPALVLGSLSVSRGTWTASETLAAPLNPVRALSTPGAATLSRSLACFQPPTARVPVNLQVRSTSVGSAAFTLHTVLSLPWARIQQPLHSPIAIMERRQRMTEMTPLIAAACGPPATANRVPARNTGIATLSGAVGARTAPTVTTGTTTLATASATFGSRFTGGCGRTNSEYPRLRLAVRLSPPTRRIPCEI